MYDDIDDDDTLTAYHEAGHAVIGFALGARIDSVQLGGEPDDRWPERFGQCRVNWGPVDPLTDWQRQREIMTILAGPVAETIHAGQPPDAANLSTWMADWSLAIQIAIELKPDRVAAMSLISQLIGRLDHTLRQPTCWSAVAAIADELLTHHWIESERVETIVGFWLRHGRR